MAGRRRSRRLSAMTSVELESVPRKTSFITPAITCLPVLGSATRWLQRIIDKQTGVVGGRRGRAWRDYPNAPAGIEPVEGVWGGRGVSWGEGRRASSPATRSAPLRVA